MWSGQPLLRWPVCFSSSAATHMCYVAMLVRQFPFFACPSACMCRVAMLVSLPCWSTPLIAYPFPAMCSVALFVPWFLFHTEVPPMQCPDVAIVTMFVLVHKIRWPLQKDDRPRCYFGTLLVVILAHCLLLFWHVT